MLPFPASLLLVPGIVLLGVVYVRAGGLRDSRLRTGLRLAILIATCVAPALTRGPGPAQLMLGLVAGYLGIRMVALSRPSRRLDGNQEALAPRVALDLLVPDDLFVPTAMPRRRPLLAAALGIAGVATCVLLLVWGNDWRLWQKSLAFRFLDDQLVMLEVAVGAAGVHHLLIGAAGLFGRSVEGFQNHPLLSASLAEFWARRWNRMVQGNLKRAFFQPYVRSHPALALLAAFTASGVLHVMAVAGAGPPSLIALPVVSIMGFFLLHAALVLAEKRLGWHRAPKRPWPLVLARIRTLVVFAELAPLLLDPFACVTHVHGRALDRPPPQPARYLKGQLHLHSSRSGDSHTPPSEVVRWYREHGFDFIVFTDHNRAGSLVQSSSPLVLSGVELTQNLRACTPPPEPGEQCLLHVNALFVDQGVTGLDPWRPEGANGGDDRLAAYVRAMATAARAGGIAQLNHPNFHHAADAALLTTLAREHGLRFFELANGSVDAGNAGDASHPSTEELWDRVLSSGGWLYGTATDDAHHYFDASEVAAQGQPVFTGGRGFVMVRAALDAGAIRAALLRGDFYASSGVLLERAEVAKDSLIIDVAADSPGPHAFTFIGTGGQVLARADGRSARFALALAPSGYLRAVVEDRQGRKAWVQPIRVPRDGQSPSHSL